MNNRMYQLQIAKLKKVLEKKYPKLHIRKEGFDMLHIVKADGSWIHTIHCNRLNNKNVTIERFIEEVDTLLNLNWFMD